ncbi:phosphonate C-P lyase system protein PhnH [Musicola paradisiaca]|uniref:Phosphonate C-P lyase system protein PhnH n=1 Tax=Musicola paradisiaca (strain Ech703) TaxID=579405 RepID=C6CDJ4_MUSP7|nr:phosphonate C-P lyase system protein PhnH [Musicola paradisiaca]ACS85111.1 phosphonate C-P lyase system protein PhnH [Musicola paradisiaca Ech703]
MTVTQSDAIQAGFADAHRDAQQVFRRLLKAMSEPGETVTLHHHVGWGALSPAATAVLLTLVDHETPLWLEPRLAQDDVVTSLRFYTGVQLTSPAQAQFAVLGVNSQQPLASFNPGDELSPERSTTLVLEVDDLAGGLPLWLTGPGLAQARMIAPQLPVAVLDYWCSRPHAFPAGLDIILTCGASLLALPRTTQVEVC